MPLWVWAIFIGVGIILIIDFIIVMGWNPRQWKGGKKNGR